MNARASWQRWTIDEIAEGTVRVLIANALYPLESTAAEALDAGAAASLRDAVVQDEAVSPDDLWMEEQEEYVDAAELEAFLLRRAETPGLPPPRDLREGDVFWVVLREAVTIDAGDEATGLLASYAEAGAQVLDVTAAARTAVKSLDYELQHAAAPED